MRGKVLDDAARKRALKRYLDGEQTAAEIAEVFGVNVRTIQRIVARAGKSYSRQHPPIRDAETLAKIAAEYNAGIVGSTVRALAGKYGMSAKGMYNTLLRAGVKLRSPRAAQFLRRAQREIRAGIAPAPRACQTPVRGSST